MLHFFFSQTTPAEIFVINGVNKGYRIGFVNTGLDETRFFVLASKRFAIPRNIYTHVSEKRFLIAS